MGNLYALLARESLDTEQELRLAFKLTLENHLAPNNFKKQKVKDAAQLMSERVALALCVRSITGSEATQGFLRFIDLAFDLTNSSHFLDKPSRRPIQIGNLNHDILAVR